MRHPHVKMLGTRQDWIELHKNTVCLIVARMPNAGADFRAQGGEALREARQTRLTRGYACRQLPRMPASASRVTASIEPLASLIRLSIISSLQKVYSGARRGCARTERWTPSATALPWCRRRVPPCYVPAEDSPQSLHATVLFQ